MNGKYNLYKETNKYVDVKDLARFQSLLRQICSDIGFERRQIRIRQRDLVVELVIDEIEADGSCNEKMRSHLE